MPLSLTPKYDDYMFQLREKVAKLMRDLFECAPWKDCDEDLRHIYEGVASVAIIAIKGETNGEAELLEDNEEIHSTALLKKAQKVTKEEVSHSYRTRAQEAWEDLIPDFYTHNINSHTNKGENSEREEKGLENIKRGIGLLCEFLLVKIQQLAPCFAGTPADMLTQFKEIGALLKSIEPFLNRPGLSQPLQEAMNRDLSNLFESDNLPSKDEAYYALILPANPSAVLRKALLPLSVFKWNFILDFGCQTGDGSLFPTWNQIVNERLNVLTEDKQLSEFLINWIYMRGADGKVSKALSRRLFDLLSRNQLPTKNIVVFDLSERKTLSLEALTGLWRLVVAREGKTGSEGSFIFSTPEAGVPLTDILAEEGYEVGALTEISSPTPDFIDAISASRLLAISGSPGSDVIPDTYRLQYLDAGMKFLDSDENYAQKSDWDNFYAGRQITKSELEKNYDVTPRGDRAKYHSFKRRLAEGVKSLNQREFFIYHLPGAGGSTVARRLAYDLEAENPGRVMTLLVSQWNAAKTPGQLRHLAANSPDIQRWVVICDDKELNQDEYSKLKYQLANKNIPSVTLRLIHVTSLPVRPAPQHILHLGARIAGEVEKDSFNDKFSKSFGAVLGSECAKIIAQIWGFQKGGLPPEIINYPYAFTEKAAEKQPVPLQRVDAYASKWFASLSSQSLRDMVGLIAFNYHFANSRATDINLLRPLWDRSGHDFFFPSLSPGDAEAIRHLLKKSPEEGSTSESTSLYAPRYAAFAPQILSAWRPAWESQLSEIAFRLLDLLPAEGGENYGPLIRSLFIYQAGQYTDRNTGAAKKSINDKLSPLLGQILEKEGNPENILRIFDSLIGKFPEKEFWKIQKARVLFEYASFKEMRPEDSRFREAAEIIDELQEAGLSEDISLHIIGMFYKRLEWAVNAYPATTLTTVEEREEQVARLLEVGYQGLEKFREYNERVKGGSSYGNVAGAQLAVSLIDHVANVRKLQGTKVLEDSDITDLAGWLEDFLAPLEEMEEQDEYARERSAESRSRFYNLVGNRDQAISLLLSRFRESGDGRYKTQLGHQAVSMMLYGGDPKLSLKARYTNLPEESRREMETILTSLRDSYGNLDAARKLFFLYRYTRNDLLASGLTTNALWTWNMMAMSQNSPRDILQSSFFAYALCAARLLDSDGKDSTLNDLYESHLRKSRELGNQENRNTGAPLLYLGSYNKGRWDSLLEPSEAVSAVDRKRVYQPVCRRFVAQIVNTKEHEQECRIGNLTGISFAYRNLTQNDIGTKELFNGVLSFRYSGPGLYDQSIRKIGSDSPIPDGNTYDLSAPPTIEPPEEVKGEASTEGSQENPAQSEAEGRKPKIGRPKAGRKKASGKFQFKGKRNGN